VWLKQQIPALQVGSPEFILHSHQKEIKKKKKYIYIYIYIYEDVYLMGFSQVLHINPALS
jgi:hypothetical protein